MDATASTQGRRATRACLDSGGPSNPTFILGADITWTQQDVAGGATYVDNGTKKPILQLLKDHGINFIRMRTFVDPTQPAPNPAGGTFGPYSTGQASATSPTPWRYGAQIKAAGMGFLLDFHYSDNWADPGKQDQALRVGERQHRGRRHAPPRLHARVDPGARRGRGAKPDMVQIGNEITPGMLTSPGTAFGPISNWTQLAQLLNAGIAAVHQVDPTIKIMIHLDRGGDLTSSVNFIRNAMECESAREVFDVFGESCYVAFQGGPATCGPILKSLATMFPTLKFAIAEYNSDLGPRPDDGQRNSASERHRLQLGQAGRRRFLLGSRRASPMG